MLIWWSQDFDQYVHTYLTPCPLPHLSLSPPFTLSSVRSLRSLLTHLTLSLSLSYPLTHSQFRSDKHSLTFSLFYEKALKAIAHAVKKSGRRRRRASRNFFKCTNQLAEGGGGKSEQVFLPRCGKVKFFLGPILQNLFDTTNSWPPFIGVKILMSVYLLVST